MKALYGLIGYPLGHSFSKGYFEEKFRNEGTDGAEYRNFPIESISRFPELIKDNPSLKGLNVTIPYKEAVIPYLTDLDPEAAQAGAVNCIKIEGGRLTGYNTDIYGFRLSLLELLGGHLPSGALVLGTGGASKAVGFVLKQLNIPYTEVSRTKSPANLTYEEVDGGILAANKLIINTTPLGMFPDVDNAAPLPYEHITGEHYLFDLVYNPSETLFLRKGRERGAKTMNGYGMLAGQAERSWQIWQG